MIGSGIAGMIATMFNVTANSIGVGGLPGILSIKNEYWFIFIICMVIAIVVPFILTVVFRKYNIFNKSDQTEQAIVGEPELG